MRVVVVEVIVVVVVVSCFYNNNNNNNPCFVNKILIKQCTSKMIIKTNINIYNTYTETRHK